MSTIVTQVRLPQGLLKEVQKLVESGLYSNQSDVIRDSIRRFVLDKDNFLGNIHDSNYVKEKIELARDQIKQGKTKENFEKIVDFLKFKFCNNLCLI